MGLSRDSPGLFLRFPGNFIYVFPFFPRKKGKTHKQFDPHPFPGQSREVVYVYWFFSPPNDYPKNLFGLFFNPKRQFWLFGLFEITSENALSWWHGRFATRFARIDSRESFAIETPIFIASPADSPESLEFPIRTNHVTKCTVKHGKLAIFRVIFRFSGYFNLWRLSPTKITYPGKILRVNFTFENHAIVPLSSCRSSSVIFYIREFPKGDGPKGTRWFCLISKKKPYRTKSARNWTKSALCFPGSARPRRKSDKNRSKIGVTPVRCPLYIAGHRYIFS